MPFDAPARELTTQDRCRILADVIESGVYGFDMETFTVPDDCGTAGCIAGTAGKLFNLPRYPDEPSWVDHTAAAHALGLSDPFQEKKIFAPWIGHDWPQAAAITRSMAARCLRRFAETGEIVWEPDPTP